VPLLLLLAKLVNQRRGRGLFDNPRRHIPVPGTILHIGPLTVHPVMARLSAGEAPLPFETKEPHEGLAREVP